jgi:hypothetical protein
LDLTTPSISTKPSAPIPQATVKDESLDDLEDFLESLNK